MYGLKLSYSADQILLLINNFVNMLFINSLILQMFYLISSDKFQAKKKRIEILREKNDKTQK